MPSAASPSTMRAKTAFRWADAGSITEPVTSGAGSGAARTVPGFLAGRDRSYRPAASQDAQAPLRSGGQADGEALQATDGQAAGWAGDQARRLADAAAAQPAGGQAAQPADGMARPGGATAAGCLLGFLTRAPAGAKAWVPGGLPRSQPTARSGRYRQNPGRPDRDWPAGAPATAAALRRAARATPWARPAQGMVRDWPVPGPPAAGSPAAGWKVPGSPRPRP